MGERTRFRGKGQGIGGKAAESGKDQGIRERTRYRGKDKVSGKGQGIGERTRYTGGGKMTGRKGRRSRVRNKRRGGGTGGGGEVIEFRRTLQKNVC